MCLIFQKHVWIANTNPVQSNFYLIVKMFPTNLREMPGEEMQARKKEGERDVGTSSGSRAAEGQRRRKPAGWAAAPEKPTALETLLHVRVIRGTLRGTAWGEGGRWPGLHAPGCTSTRMHNDTPQSTRPCNSSETPSQSGAVVLKGLTLARSDNAFTPGEGVL